MLERGRSATPVAEDLHRLLERMSLASQLVTPPARAQRLAEEERHRLKKLSRPRPPDDISLDLPPHPATEPLGALNSLLAPGEMGSRQDDGPSPADDAGLAAAALTAEATGQQIGQGAPPPTSLPAVALGRPATSEPGAPKVAGTAGPARVPLGHGAEGFHGASPATSIGTAPPVPATSPSAFGQDAPSADTAAADTGTAAVPAPAQTGIGEPAGAAASRAGAAGLRPAAPEQDAGSGQRAGVEAAPAEAEVTATTPTVDATDVFRSMVGAVAEGAAPPAEAALSVLGDRAAERTASAAVDAGAGFEYALVDLPARLQLAGVGLAMEVRIVALTPDLALGAVTTPDAIAAEGGHRLTLPLPGVAQPLAMPVRLAGQRPDTDEQGNARQLLEIRLEWEDTAPREVLLAYYRQAQEAAIDPLQPVAANVKIEVLEGPRAGSQFLGKSSYAGRAAVQCSVDNFDVSPETRVRFSLIAPRFVEQLTLADGVVAALTPGSGRRVEVQIQFAAAHDELIAFVTKYFAERPGASLPFLSRFRRNAG